MGNSLKKWILLAEDDSELVDLYESYLELHFGTQLKIIKAEDGVIATNKLPFQAFDLIITDLNMPKKSGQAFIKAVHESQMNSKTPVLVITGEEPDDLNPQQVSIFLKPLSQTDFVNIVENQLKLGKTDQRVAADLLNAFIDSAKYLIKHTTGEDSSQKEPLPKRDKEGVHGDYFRLISVKVGKTKNQFLFGFEDSVISKMCEKYGKEGEEGIKTVVSAAGDTICRQSIRRIGTSDITILNQETIKKSGEGYDALFKIRGIHIPLETEVGHVNVYGLWK